MKRRLSVRVPPALALAMQECMDRRGYTQANLVKEALREFLKKRGHI